MTWDSFEPEKRYVITESLLNDIEIYLPKTICGIKDGSCRHYTKSGRCMSPNQCGNMRCLTYEIRQHPYPQEPQCNWVLKNLLRVYKEDRETDKDLFPSIYYDGKITAINQAIMEIEATSAITPEQCPHWECIEHSDGMEWCCSLPPSIPPKMAISKENRCTLNCPAIRDDGGPYYCRIKQKYVAPFEKRCNYGFDIVKGGQITHNGYHDECEAFSLFCDTTAQQRIADVIGKLENEASKHDGKDILVANAFRRAIALLREELE